MLDLTPLSTPLLLARRKVALREHSTSVGLLIVQTVCGAGLLSSTLSLTF